MGSVEAYDGTTVMAADRAPLVPEGWVADAACKGQTHLFFPPLAERPQARVRREAQARVLCRELPGRAAVPRVRPDEPGVRAVGRRVGGGAPPGRVHGRGADRGQGALGELRLSRSASMGPWAPKRPSTSSSTAIHSQNLDGTCELVTDDPIEYDNVPMGKNVGPEGLKTFLQPDGRRPRRSRSSWCTASGSRATARARQ